MNGIIVVNKPYGFTSHRVVQMIRGLFPGVKAGHSGTLDPIATGVLPVCLGRATRIAEYIMEHPKTYRASVTLGRTTDTDDCTGAVTATKTVPKLEKDLIKKILSSFEGSIEQMPPRYSAVKYRGKPLYLWTRSGKEVPRAVRRAQIFRIELLEFNPAGEPQLVFDVDCSKGTYIRTLALDIGAAVGCGAHLQALSRQAVGPFNLQNAFTLEKIERLCRDKRFEELIKPMDTALTMMPPLCLDQEQVKALKNGQKVNIKRPLSLMQPGFRKKGTEDKKPETGNEVRIYDRKGDFKAIARLEKIDEDIRLKTLKYLST